IHFKTGLSDEEVAADLGAASAFIFASFEDFGIAPVEAMAAGTPIIAYKAGGALDYAIPGKTGEFFEEQTVESLKQALADFNPRHYKPETLKRQAQHFSAKNFQSSLREFLERNVSPRNQ